MAPTVPTGEPTQAVAGDTWTWKRFHSDYPNSEGWALSYSIRGVSAPAWSASWVTTTGSGWLVTIPAATTALIGAGRYEFAAHFTGSGSYAGQAYTEDLPPLTVEVNYRVAAAGTLVSHAATMIPLLETAIQALVTGNVKSYTIGSRQVTKHDLAELRQMLGLYRAEVKRQANPDTLAQPVQARFTRVA